jgi:hypothetical protein
MHKLSILSFVFSLLSGLIVTQSENIKLNKESKYRPATIIHQTAIEEQTEDQDQKNAKNWLIKTIEVYFSKDFSNMEDITTKSYVAYKIDAMNLEYDESLTEEGFKKKWKNKFDTRYVGYEAFLVPTQDNGKIKVTSCKLLSVTKDKAYIFETIIRDLDYKQNYKRDIKVIRSGKTFLIADVKEY